MSLLNKIHLLPPGPFPTVLTSRGFRLPDHSFLWASGSWLPWWLALNSWSYLFFPKIWLCFFSKFWLLSLTLTVCNQRTWSFTFWHTSHQPECGPNVCWGKNLGNGGQSSWNWSRQDPSSGLLVALAHVFSVLNHVINYICFSLHFTVRSGLRAWIKWEIKAHRQLLL